MTGRVLAVDPGTKCGYAFTDTGKVVPELCGWWDLQPSRHEGAGMRFVRLRMYLDEMAPKVLVYEEVAAHKGTAAAQIYGGLISTIQTYCEQHNVPYLGIPVGTVKKAATGRGNASKDEMHAAAVLKLGMAVRGTEDEADALWILHTWLAGVPRSE